MSSAGENNVYGAYDDLTRNSRVTTSRADSSSSASPPSCSLHHHHHHLGGFMGASTTAELSDDELGDLPSCAYAGRNTGSGVQQLQYLGVSGQCTYIGLCALHIGRSWLRLFVGFLCSSRHIPGYCFKLSHERFLPSPFQFIIHQTIGPIPFISVGL